MKTRFACMLIIIALTSIGTSAPAFSEQGRSLTLSCWEVQAAVALRYQYGLDDDEDYTRSILMEFGKENPYGLAMTEEEKASLENRFAYQHNHKGPVLDYLDTLSSYAWSYFDQEHGGQFRIGLKGPDATNKAIVSKLKTLYGWPEMITVHKALYSEEEMAEVATRIFRERHPFKKDGFVIKRTAVNPQTESVEVQIEGSIHAARTALVRRYPQVKLTILVADAPSPAFNECKSK